MSRLLAPLALLAGGLLFSALMAEIALRVVLGSPIHFRYPQPRYLPDPVLGHWMEPGQQSFNHDKPLSVNSVGIRGEDRPREPDPGTLRVLALGDSQTFGNGLAGPDTWPGRLEHELREEPDDPSWEVLNGGLPATDTWQHEVMLARLARSYDFDAVVLGFYINDVTRVYRPGTTSERTNTQSKRLVYVLKRSALFAFIGRTYSRLTASQWRAEREQSILTGTPQMGVEEAWRQVEESLAGMQELTRSLGAGFLVAVIPRRDQVAAADPPTAYNERVAQIGSRLGIPVVDVLEPLQEAYDEAGDGLFIPWDGHNSARANAVIARALAPHVRALKKLVPIADGA